MSERKKCKLHGSAFKAKVGMEAVRGVMTVNEIGQAHEVHPVQVSQWKKVNVRARIQPDRLRKLYRKGCR